MGLDFINRVARTSVLLAVIQIPFVIVYYDWRFAIGVLLGCLWNAANLMLLKYLITGLISPSPGGKRNLLLLGLVKFPLLYAIGYFLLKFDYFSPDSLLVGFTVIFLVALLKALGIYFIDNRAVAVQKPGEDNGNNT